MVEKQVARLLFLLFFVGAPSVYAQPALTEAERKEVGRLLIDAKTAFDDGQYDAAIVKLERAYAAYPDANILFRIGQCHERLGDHGLAIAYYKRYLADTPEATDRETVQALIARLEEASKPEEPRTGLVTFNTEPQGATVRVADQTFVTPVTIELKKGTHAVQFELDGYEKSERTINVDGGSTNQYSIPLFAVVPESSGPGVATWVFGALSILSAAGSVTSFIISANANSDVSTWDEERNRAYAENTNIPERPDGYDDAVERAALFQNLGIGTGIAAGLFAGAALITILVSGDNSERVSISPTGLGFAF